MLDTVLTNETENPPPEKEPVAQFKDLVQHIKNERGAPLVGAASLLRALP